MRYGIQDENGIRDTGYGMDIVSARILDPKSRILHQERSK